MSEYDDRPRDMARAVERLEDGVEVSGGGGCVVGGDVGTVTKEVVPAVVAEPRS